MDHPTIDEMLLFHEGQLCGADAESVRLHVSCCADCTEELALVQRWDSAFAIPERRERGPAQNWGSWERFRSILRRHGPEI